MKTLQQIEALGILPIITIDSIDDALPLALALIKGGVLAAEVTFRTDVACEAIRLISKEYPQLLLGAGTVLNKNQCDQALEAGAKFVISPGYNDELVAYCQEINILTLPGCMTPTDFSKAVEAGLEAVKFFPAQQTGGITYLEAIAPVFPKLRFVPTGGINQSNIMQYLSRDFVLACGGSWMVNRDLILAGDFEKISEKCSSVLSLVKML